MEKDPEHPQGAPPPYMAPPANYGGTASTPQAGFPAGPSLVSYPPPTQFMGVPSMTPAGSTVILTSGLSNIPCQTQCPHCQQLVVSQTRHTPGLLTWLICGTLTLFGCWLCCFIPFCMDDCKDVEHRCPNCNNLVYVYKRM
ncbi:hypothetical protein JZ751_021538 [Albula glossodonta]|uniref:LITAF domain-containing protein n=1 Tax=Albula glossodonta TaxID=121402 RepID=A0A8T2NJ52_9TELE|nr:hypothetical protein JZ751_021538 [Albula glossodonta]